MNAKTKDLMPRSKSKKKEAHNMRYIVGLVKTVIKPRMSVSAFIAFRGIGMNTMDALKGVTLAHVTEIIKFN